MRLASSDVNIVTSGKSVLFLNVKGDGKGIDEPRAAALAESLGFSSFDVAQVSEASSTRGRPRNCDFVIINAPTIPSSWKNRLSGATAIHVPYFILDNCVGAIRKTNRIEICRGLIAKTGTGTIPGDLVPARTVTALLGVSNYWIYSLQKNGLVRSYHYNHLKSEVGLVSFSAALKAMVEAHPEIKPLYKQIIQTSAVTPVTVDGRIQRSLGILADVVRGNHASNPAWRRLPTKTKSQLMAAGKALLESCR